MYWRKWDNNAQQVIRYIWFEFRASVREKCIELFGPGGNLRLGNDTERPSKFSHLCASMNKLMVAAFGFSSSPSDRGVGAGVEEETEEVSSTSSSSSRHVYFHLVLERVDSIGSLDGDDPQHSLMSKLLQLSTHAHPHIKVVATCRSAVWGSNLPNAMTVTFPPLEESVSRALLLSRLDGIVTATLRDSTASEDAKQAVAEAIHLPTLCRLFESVWSRMFKCSLVDSTRNLLEMCKISGNLLSLDSALSTSLKPVPALTAALSLPVYGLLLEDGADERVLGRFSADWRRNPGWCEQLSRRVRYVLMACFIASNNPAESDLMKLTEAQSGRRKKQRFGVDTSAADASSSSSAVSLSSLSGRSALPSRCFSLERLHGIFCLMVTAGQGGCATDSMFGDSGLNSTIRDLVEQRVLDAAPNWTLTAPQYTSSVSYVTALEAARSVGLRLSDYLMGNDSAYPLASSNTPPSKQKHSITARDYDLIEAKRALLSSLPAELIGVLFMHLVLHWNTPLLLAPLSLLGSKLQSPVVQINLLGLQAVGPLKRPFAGMMDALLASLNTETIPNPSAGDDATDSLTGSDVEQTEQTEVDENETVDSADLEDTLSDEIGRDKIVDDRERDVGDDEEDEEVEGGPQCVSAHCPEHKCTQAVTQDVYDSFLVGDKVALEKFDRYLCTHFVNCNKTMRFCPAANCEKVATGGDIHSQNAVRCPCSCVFCFDCGEESHAPSGCAQLSKWIEKCMSDGESAKWIFANTKKCPKCNTRIEKNQGCNHMTCRQCKHEFCWICMGNWAKHQQCNRYASEASQSEQTAQEIIRAELDRYLHYYNRYQAHDNSLKFAAKQRIAALQKMREMQERQSDAWIDVQYVRDAVEEVIECRRVLKYTYVVGFYMEEWCPERELFASHQQMLEEHTEKLHECTEGKNVFKADRTQVVNWTRVTQNFRNAILDNFVDGEMMAGEAGATRGDLNNKQVWSSSRKKPADSNGNDDRSATHIMNASLLRTSLSRAGGRTGGGRGGGRGDEGEWEDARGFGLGDDDEEDGLDEDLMRAIEASLADSR
eukprot:gene24380-30721_t